MFAQLLPFEDDVLQEHTHVVVRPEVRPAFTTLLVHPVQTLPAEGVPAFDRHGDAQHPPAQGAVEQFPHVPLHDVTERTPELPEPRLGPAEVLDPPGAVYVLPEHLPRRGRAAGDVPLGDALQEVVVPGEDVLELSPVGARRSGV